MFDEVQLSQTQWDPQSPLPQRAKMRFDAQWVAPGNGYRPELAGGRWAN